MTIVTPSSSFSREPARISFRTGTLRSIVGVEGRVVGSNGTSMVKMSWTDCGAAGRSMLSLTESGVVPVVGAHGLVAGS